LSSNAERREFIASWMSGYIRASRSQPVFDFQRFANNKKAVENYCKKRGAETLMSAIQKTAR
jgi:HdeA/HdeB family